MRKINVFSLLVLIFWWPKIGLGLDDDSCRAVHAQAHGVNLICCSLNQSLTTSCEFSSICREYCSCFLTISRDLDCRLDSFQAGYEWLDHQPNPSPISCQKPNFPNPTSPYEVVIEDSDPKLTYQLLIGSCSINVKSITLQSYDPIYDTINFAQCFPNLTSFQIILLRRKKANFTKSLRDLKFLSTLSIVNVDFNFWLQPSPFLNTISYLHVENSSLSELPKWFARSESLSTIYLKNTRLHSLSTIVQLPATRSLKLSHNAFEQLHRHIFISSALLHIDLSYNKILSFSSHTFSKCTDLRILDLTGNPIKMLPYKPFFKNSRLKWLKLSRTNITTLNPDHFQGLGSLKTLTLSKMPLQSISPFSLLPIKSLRYLDMDSCNLTRIPQAVTFNCHLTRLNVANNLLHRSSSFPPEVMAGLSGLAHLRIDGNPLIEFPPSFLLISRENARLLRQLLHSTMLLPVWTSEPCTPYYWTMRISNRSTTLRNFLTQYSTANMLKNGLSHCGQQFDWMMEQMDVYRELEKNSGCSTFRRLRSSLSPKKLSSSAATSSSSKPINNCSTSFKSSFFLDSQPPSIPQLLIVSISANFVLIFLLLTCFFIGCTYEKK